MNEKMKDNKLNESEMDEISGGANGKHLFSKITVPVVTYGYRKPLNIYPINWTPNKKPEQKPTDPEKPKDTTDTELPKVDPNSENKL